MNPTECQADKCGYRSALEEIERLKKEMSEMKKRFDEIRDWTLCQNKMEAEKRGFRMD